MEQEKERKSCMMKKEVWMVIVTGVALGLCLFYGTLNVVRLAVAPLDKNIESLKQSFEKIQRFEKALEQLEKVTQQHQQPALEESYDQVYDLPIGKSYVLGSLEAPITIMEFSDIECPFCSRFHPVVKALLQEYPEQIKIVIKHFPLPFHPNARMAAKAFLAAGLQGKAFELLDELYVNNRQLSEETIQKLALQIGLNMEQFNQDLQTQETEFEKILEDDFRLVQEADVRGTPTYFLNGKKVSARTIEEWKQEIESLLK